MAHEAASDSGRSAVVLYEYANEEKPKAAAFDRRSKLLFERSFDKKIYALTCTDRYVAVLFDDGVELISSGGKTAKTVSAGKTERESSARAATYMCNMRQISQKINSRLIIKGLPL